MFEPFQYEFFVRGLIAATLVGGLCGLIGVYIVLRRMAYIGHGLAHAVFGGAVASYLMSINFFLGASVWGFVSALLITATARQRKISGGLGHRDRDYSQLRLGHRPDQPVQEFQPAASMPLFSATYWGSRRETCWQ